MSHIDPRHIHISDYNYPLPDERIAKFPIARRDHSKTCRSICPREP